MTPPLHTKALRPGQWWACTNPERPWDDKVVIDRFCQKCLKAATVYLDGLGDVQMRGCEDRRGHSLKRVVDDTIRGQ